MVRNPIKVYLPDPIRRILENETQKTGLNASELLTQVYVAHTKNIHTYSELVHNDVKEALR